MKKLISILLFVMMSCEVESNGSKETINLIDKTIEYQYGDDKYHVTFDSDTELHWESLQGDEKGIVFDEIYVSEWIDDNRLFISWEEANGIAVSQILDFGDGIVYNHLLRDREASSGTGKIRFVESNNQD